MKPGKMPNCRLCSASFKHQSVRADHVYGGGEEHKFFHCSNCDLVYLWPIPSESEEKLFYANEFEKFMEVRSGGDRDWSGPEAHIKSNQDNVKRRMDVLKQYFRPGSDILEIGCSSGFMLNAFRDAGLSAIGIEPSGGFREFLEKTRHTWFASIEDMRNSLPEKRFDVIVHFFVLEHIRDTQRFLRDQVDLLNKDGVIVAEVPCVSDPLTSLFEIPEFAKFYWSIAHHYYFSPTSLSRILDSIECRYEIVPEQRYDISNHLIWMQKGIPGGQGYYDDVFSSETKTCYMNDLKKKWLCDTMFVHIWK